ncbi:hypothetical protein ACF0H5_000517 [Mactra antiquata]
MDDHQRQNMYKHVLIQVSDLIDQESLEKMKFRCGEIICRREREKIKSPLELWSSLETRERLGVKNLHFLKDLLTSCLDRLTATRAISLVHSYESTSSGVGGLHGYQANGANNSMPRNVPANPGLFTPSLPPMIDIRQSNNVFQKEFRFLCSSLGGDWEFFIRELDVPDSEIEVIRLDFRYTKQQIYQCLLVWLKLNQQNATKEKLITALREVKRVDLAEQMENDDY